MDRDTIDEAALAMLVENNWQEFVEYSGGEESAETTLRALKDAAGMDQDVKTGVASAMGRPLLVDRTRETAA
ncbi:MAG: hypothetical protein DBY37_07100 [Desulfovibrionaceae bacterium]|nr:MAG: hypothetical protein DBY37_07100 [Desulfovibrionaceae bacterium]